MFIPAAYWLYSVIVFQQVHKRHLIYSNSSLMLIYRFHSTLWQFTFAIMMLHAKLICVLLQLICYVMPSPKTYGVDMYIVTWFEKKCSFNTHIIKFTSNGLLAKYTIVFHCVPYSKVMSLVSVAAFLRPCVCLKWCFSAICWSWLSCIGRKSVR